MSTSANTRGGAAQPGPDPSRREVHEGTRHGGGRSRRLWLGLAAVAGVLVLVAVIALNLGSGGPSGSSASPSELDPSATFTSPESSSESSPQASSSRQPLGRLETVAWWDRRFDRYWRSEQDGEIALSRSPDSWDHYSLSYSVDSLTVAYQATGNRAYLDDALRLVENVVASARPSRSLPGSDFKDGFRGWASAQESGDEVPLYESYFWRYATSLLAVIHETPRLADDAAIQSRYRALLAFAERHVAQKWLERGARDSIFRSRTHMAAHWALIGLNLAELTADGERRSQYRGIASAIDRGMPNNGGASLREQLQPNPRDGAAYYWSDVWGTASRPGQDVSHGSGVISYMVAAQQRGGEWTATDITRFVRLLDAVVWPRAGLVTEYVDGSGVSNGWLADGWVKLGRFDPDLQRRLERHTVQNGQFLANGAMNAAVLRCRPGAGNAPPACDAAAG